MGRAIIVNSPERPDMTFANSASRGTRTVTKALVLACLLVAVARVDAQESRVDLPFSDGEVLSYRAVSTRFGSFGTGTLRVDGPEDVRGESTHRLSFEFRGRVAVFTVQDYTQSWVNQEATASFRYSKRESSPLGSRLEEVEIYPAERRWQAASGSGGKTNTSEPLDELSFLYYLRTLPLQSGDVYTLFRHFNPSRNP